MPIQTRFQCQLWKDFGGQCRTVFAQSFQMLSGRDSLWISWLALAPRIAGSSGGDASVSLSHRNVGWNDRWFLARVQVAAAMKFKSLFRRKASPTGALEQQQQPQQQQQQQQGGSSTNNSAASPSASSLSHSSSSSSLAARSASSPVRSAGSPVRSSAGSSSAGRSSSSGHGNHHRHHHHHHRHFNWAVSTSQLIGLQFANYGLEQHGSKRGKGGTR